MKVIFAGTPEFAAVALAALHASGFDIPLVLTQPDRPAGRGMQLQPSAVKQFALAHQIPVAQPVSLRTEGKYPHEARQAIDLLRATPHDVMVVAAYGLILPSAVLNIPRLGCLNIHASLLPRWRGAAPIHRAIEAGDAETGITIMQMDEGLDTGAMLLAQKEAIRDDDTAAILHDRLAALGGRLIVEALNMIGAGKLAAVPQPEAGVTYAAKIAKEEAALDFRLPAATLMRRIRAFTPFPGASGNIAGQTLKIWNAGLSARQGRPGEILEIEPAGVLVACGEGALLLTELQKPGGKRLTAAEFVKGYALHRGQQFEIHT